MPDVYVSTGALPGNCLSEVLNVADQWGLRHIELSAGLVHQRDMAEAVLRASERFRFLVHNYFPPPPRAFLLNLASASPVIREQSIALCTEAIGLCQRIGAPFYSVHCGFAFDSDGSHLGRASQLELPRIGLDAAMDYFTRSLRRLVAVAEKTGVLLAIENNVLAQFGLIDGGNRTCLGADSDSLMHIFDAVGSDRLHLLLDLGHAKVNAGTLGVEPIALIDRFHSRIIAVHISDNNGIDDQNLPLRPESDLIPHLRRLDVPWVIESRHTTVDTLIDEIRLLRTIAPVEG